MKCSSGKVAYPDQISAMVGLSNIQYHIRMHPHHAFRKYPVRVYHCPECHHWHLTSKYDWRNNNEVLWKIN